MTKALFSCWLCQLGSIPAPPHCVTLPQFKYIIPLLLSNELSQKQHWYCDVPLAFCFLCAFPSQTLTSNLTSFTLPAVLSIAAAGVHETHRQEGRRGSAALWHRKLRAQFSGANTERSSRDVYSSASGQFMLWMWGNHELLQLIHVWNQNVPLLSCLSFGGSWGSEVSEVHLVKQQEEEQKCLWPKGLLRQAAGIGPVMTASLV